MFILPQSNVNFGGNLILYIIYSILPIMIYIVKFIVKIILKSVLILLPVSFHDSKFEFHHFIWMVKQDCTNRDSKPYLFLQYQCHSGWLTQSNWLTQSLSIFIWLIFPILNLATMILVTLWWWQFEFVGGRIIMLVTL